MSGWGIYDNIPGQLVLDGSERPDAVIVKEGTLKKRAIGKSFAGKKNWKHRYFKLTKDTLAYYQEAFSKTPKGSINMGQVIHVKPWLPTEGPGFNVTHHHINDATGMVDPKEYVLMCLCPDIADRDEWLSRIADVCGPQAEGWDGGAHVDLTALIRPRTKTGGSVTSEYGGFAGGSASGVSGGGGGSIKSDLGGFDGLSVDGASSFRQPHPSDDAAATFTEIDPFGGTFDSGDDGGTTSDEELPPIPPPEGSSGGGAATQWGFGGSDSGSIKSSYNA